MADPFVSIHPSPTLSASFSDPRKLRAELESLAESNYQIFAKNLLPGVENVLGVRLPFLRKIAKRETNGNWRNLFKEADHPLSMEETMVYGMILGYANDMEWEEFLIRLAQFIPKIDNWSVCDSVCCTLKKIKTNRSLFWEFLMPYLSSSKEFEVRFAAVILLNFYIDEKWIERTICVLMPLRPTAYYAKMGIAWALSICFLSFPETTKALIKRETIEEEIYQKMVQKIIESSRTPKEEKERLRAERKAFKRNKKNLS